VHEEGCAFVILDGKIIDTARVAGTTISREGQTIDRWYSGKTHSFGGNIQAVMRPDGLPVWVSAVEPGNTHDLVAAHQHALGALCAAAAHRLPTLADPGYAGAGIGAHTPFKQPADGRRLGVDNRTYNTLLRSLRCHGERGFALLVGRWRVLRHVTASPNRIGNLNAAPGTHPIRAPVRIRLEHQVALIPRAWLTPEVGRVGRADRDEPGFRQHPLGRGILAGGGRPQCAQPVLGRRQPAQLPDGRGRYATAGDMLRDPVAEFRSVVFDVDQIEPAEHRAILGDEHVEGTDAGLLLSQQGVVPAGELVEEVVATVGDRGSEVGAVRQLEGQNRRGMIGMQPLQLGHRPTLPT
jgi:hypothetical protein